MKRKNIYLFIICFVSVFMGINFFAYAQQKEDLLEKYISAQGYKETIIFDVSNIKQYWIDKTVISKNDSIVVLLPNDTGHKKESKDLFIQLANVNMLQICTIDVITETKDMSFSISDKSNNVLSTSAVKEDFIQYHLLSTTVNLEDIPSFSFKFKFVSNTLDMISIKKIILSFSPNKNTNVLETPGIIKIGTNDFITAGGTSQESTNTPYSFSVTGVYSQVISKKKIIVSNNILKNTVKIKNIGDKPVKIYLGYAPYTKDGNKIDSKNNIYNAKNSVYKVVSHQENSKSIIIDKFPAAWEKGCFLALNAKEDNSDFPNFSIIDGSIQAIKTLDNNRAEIVFDKPIKELIAEGTSVRIHSPEGATYIYTDMTTLQPGEEADLSSTIEKDNMLLEYTPKAFCKGTYYVLPVLLAYTEGSKESNTVLVSDFIVSY